MVRFENFKYSYSRNGKPVFVPTLQCKKIGDELKHKIENTVEMPDFFYHLKRGGHVSALHKHREHRFFARIDIERYFYGIGRNRVCRVLRGFGIGDAERYARWSCVKNPYRNPSYSLPYGFVQSPILATLVLLESQVGKYIRDMSHFLGISVYMDDITLSSDDGNLIECVFDEIVDGLISSGFAVNRDKTLGPRGGLDVFNCGLSHGNCFVLASRIDKFYEIEHSIRSQNAFEAYRSAVSKGNAVAESA